MKHHIDIIIDQKDSNIPNVCDSSVSTDQKEKFGPHILSELGSSEYCGVYLLGQGYTNDIYTDFSNYSKIYFPCVNTDKNKINQYHKRIFFFGIAIQ